MPRNIATRWSSETSNEKSFLLLASAITTPMMSASGLVIPARKRGFWLRMAARSVLPERGSPEMKWNLRADFTAWDATGMRALSAKVRPDSMIHLLRSDRPAHNGSDRPARDGDRDALGWKV